MDVVQGARMSSHVTDHLPIVMVKTEIDFTSVFDGFPKTALYHSKLDRFKNGDVTDKQHITVRYGLLPLTLSGFSELLAVTQALAKSCSVQNTTEGLVITGAVAWDPPESSTERGEPFYKCVVLLVEKDPGYKNETFVSQLAAKIDGIFPVLNAFRSSQKYHITVAYVRDDRDEDNPSAPMTAIAANRLVASLNAKFKGKSLGEAKLVVDDNDFPMYNTLPRLRY